jgi:putative heme transporter
MISADGTKAAGGGSRTTKYAVRVVLLAVVLYFLVLPQTPAFRAAASDLRSVEPVFLLMGFALVMASIACYSGLTRSALGEDERVSHLTMFCIQLATRSVTNVVPGGSAAGSALGFRLLTSAGVGGPAAGFALATAALGSAVVLNVVFWFGLMVSIPVRGVNPLYALGALAGVLIMVIVAVLCIGLIDGSGRAERAVRWVAGKLRLDPDRWANVLREVGQRVSELVADRSLLRRVVGWSLGQWLFDMAALWVFLRAFGHSLDVDALIVAFGLANILAAIPITPGGLGVVEAVYLTTLVGFGVPSREATLGVASYRIAQYFFPIVLGALAYLSLRLGKWSVRDERLEVELEVDEDATSASRVDFLLDPRHHHPGRPPPTPDDR